MKRARGALACAPWDEVLAVVDEGITQVAMLFCTNILAYVGACDDTNYPHNYNRKLTLLHTKVLTRACVLGHESAWVARVARPGHL